MTGVSWWILIAAILDLFRAHRDTTSRKRALSLGAAGGVVLITLMWSAHPRHWQGWSAWALAAILLVAWLVASSELLNAVRTTSVTPLPRRVWLLAGIAFGSFALSVLTLGLVGDLTGQVHWLDHALSHSVVRRTDPDGAVQVAAAFALQISTANILIRMTLSLVGVPAADNEKKLRGGRILGPMERLLILGLGMSSGVGGATLVVAAKALLRFPEVRANPPSNPEAPAESGPTDVTEYLLIGSFASWLTAFASIGFTLAYH